jgi:hypothetical protein
VICRDYGLPLVALSLWQPSRAHYFTPRKLSAVCQPFLPRGRPGWSLTIRNPGFNNPIQTRGIGKGIGREPY